MSDSGRQIGDCKHAKNPAWCVNCLREAIVKLADGLTVIGTDLGAQGEITLRVEIVTTGDDWNSFCELAYKIKG